MKGNSSVDTSADSHSVKEMSGEDYPSATERFLAEVVAPELLSPQGRISILSIWFIFSVVSFLGIQQLQIAFNITYFIDESKYIFEYYEMNDKYFEKGFTITTYVENAEVDYSSKET